MSKPETVFKVGAVRASIFKNLIQKNGRSIPLPKVVIEVRYKDKTGQWQGTNSLSINDLPKAILALQKAFEYLMEHKDSVQQPQSSFSSEEFEYWGPQIVRNLSVFGFGHKHAVVLFDRLLLAIVDAL
jgi:hypothetical protein